MSSNELNDDASIISGASISSRQPMPLPVLEIDLATIVPLYGKETNKNEIKVTKVKKNRTNVTLPVGERMLQPLKEEMPKKKVDSPTDRDDLRINLGPVDSKGRKGYLDLFYEKIGYVSKITQKPSDTTRSVIDENTSRSLGSRDDSSVFSDALSYVSDSSFYKHFLEEEQKKVHVTFERVTESPKISPKSDSPSQLKSISQYSVISCKTNKTTSSRKSNEPMKMTKYNKTVVNVPILGGLGPDPLAVREKMQKLIRQQSYGLQASKQNRINFTEKEILKNLKAEMHRSSELSKSSNDILFQNTLTIRK